MQCNTIVQHLEWNLTTCVNMDNFFKNIIFSKKKQVAEGLCLFIFYMNFKITLSI
jgi:hypothetical protein